MRNAKILIKKMRAILGVDVKLAVMELENGVSIEAEEFEPNAEVFIIGQEERVALPVGEYVTVEGKVITIVEEGIIDSIGDKEVEEEVVEEIVEEVVEEELANEVVTEEVIEEEVEFVSLKDFQKEIETLKKMIEDLSKDAEEVDLGIEEVVEEVELSTTITHTPDNKVVKSKEFLTKPKSTLNRVFDRINK